MTTAKNNCNHARGSLDSFLSYLVSVLNNEVEDDVEAKFIIFSNGINFGGLIIMSHVHIEIQMGLIPGPYTSTCHGCSQKKKKKERKNEKVIGNNIMAINCFYKILSVIYHIPYFPL